MAKLTSDQIYGMGVKWVKKGTYTYKGKTYNSYNDMYKVVEADYNAKNNSSSNKSSTNNTTSKDAFTTYKKAAMPNLTNSPFTEKASSKSDPVAVKMLNDRAREDMRSRVSAPASPFASKLAAESVNPANHFPLVTPKKAIQEVEEQSASWPVKTSTNIIANNNTQSTQVEALINELSVKKAKYTDKYWQTVHDEAVSRFRAEGKWDSVKIENRAWALVDEQRRAWEKEKEEIEKQIRRLSGVRDATWKDVTIGSLKRGYQQSRFGDESFDKMWGLENEADAINKTLQSDEYQFAADGFVKEGISGAAELIGQMAYTYTKPKTWTLATGSALAGAGAAAVAGQMGPQIALPEEIATVPAGALYGLSAGLAGATAENALRVEAGHAYNEMIESGISENTAKGIALAVGTVNAALEMFQVDELVDAYKVLNKSGATSTVADRILKELIDRGVDVAKETAQEVTQEGVTMGGAELAHRIDKGKGLYSWSDVGGRLGDTARSSVLSFGLLNVPATISNVAKANKNAQTVADINKTAEALNGIIEDDNAKIQPLSENATKEELARKKTEINTAIDDIRQKQTPTETNPLEQAAREVVQNRNARTTISPAQMVEELSKNGQKITVEEAKEASGYGDNGAKVLADFVNNTEGKSFSQVEGDMRLYYEAGLVNKQDVKLENDLQREAYSAGVTDREISRIKATEGIFNNRVFSREESGLITPESKNKGNLNPAAVPKTVSRKMVKALDVVGKALGRKVMFVDSITVNGKEDGAHAQVRSDGVFEISVNSKQPLYELLFHEPLHIMRQENTAEYHAFVDFAVQHAEYLDSRLELGNGRNTKFEGILAQYQEYGISLDYDANIDEIAARFAEKLARGDRDAIRLIEKMAQNTETRTALQRFFDVLKDIIDKCVELWNRLKKQGEYAAAEELGITISELKKAKELYAKALTATAEKAQRRASEQNTKSENKTELNESEGYTSSYSFNESFGKQLDDWLEGNGKAYGSYNGNYFELGTTPDILVKHGAPEGNVIMYEDCLLKIAGLKHSIALSELAKIPSQLNDPILLFKGSVKDSFVALTELKAKNGHDVIVAIHINKRQGRTIINKIASVYSKTNNIGENKITDYVIDQIEQGNLLDASIKKAPLWFTASGLQLPHAVQTIIDAEISVPQNSKSVKGSFSLKDSNQRLSPIAMENRINELREEMSNIEDELAFSDDADEKKLNNRLVKLQYELDSLIAEERKAAVKTTLPKILDNLSKYRLSDLHSLAEQVSDGAWDDYEDLSRDELESELREAIESRMADLSPEEQNEKRFGFSVRPVNDNVVKVDFGARYSLINNRYDKAIEMQKEINQLSDKIKDIEKSEDFGRVMKMLTEALDNGDTKKGLAEYEKWRNETGYGELYAKRDALRKELDDLRADLKASEEKERVDKEQQAIAKSGLSEAEYFRKQAVKEFGYTPYFYDAGYITPNGKMLNFSGEKGQHYGSRGEDHRAIGIIYENVSGGKAMLKFMGEGNVRIMPESPGIDIASSVEPSKEQYATIKKFIREYAGKEYFNVDLTNAEGITVGNYEYEGRVSADRVVNDIKYFFENGATREQSELAKFYSLKTTNLSSKDTKELLDIIGHLKSGFEVTKFAKADPKKLAKMTKDLLKEYSSQADLDKTTKAIDELYQYLANGEDGHPAAWNEVYSKAYEIAENIINNALVVDDELYTTYKGLREYLRKTPIKFDSRYDSVPSGYDNYQDFRRRNWGRFNFTKNGTSIDKVYQELSELYPEFFNADEQINPQDQFERIVEVLDEIQPSEVNPYSSEMQQMTSFLANDIIDRFFDVPQAKPTFADKAERRVVEARIAGGKKVEAVRQQKDEKIQKLLDKQRVKTKKLIENAKTKKAEAVNKEKAKREKAISNMKESQKAKVLRARIFRHTKDLDTKLRKGTDNKHIPDDLVGMVSKLLESINLESNYTYDVESGRYKKNDNGLPTKRTKEFEELRKLYSEIASSVVVDPDLLGDNGLLSDVILLADKRVVDMNSTELETVWKTICAVEASISTANKMFSKGKYETIFDVAEKLWNDNNGKKGKYYGPIRKGLNVDMLTPETFLHYLGDAGDSMFRMMRDAQDKHISIMKEVADFTHKTLKDVNVNSLEKTIHTVTLGGEEVQLSTAQLMELYVLVKREQAIDHIFKGGILPDVIAKKKKLTRAEPIRNISMGEITEALSNLTDDQKKIADKLQRYVSSVLSEYGNEASMQVYNYRKFNEQNYWTIRTNKQEIQSEIGKDTAVTSVANKGMTKATKPHANTSVRIGSIFDTFSSHSSDMATYAAWLGTSEDINRIRNFVFWNDNARVGTVKGILDKVHGTKGSAYLEKLLTDIAIGVQGVDSMNPFDKLAGTYKAASVGANVRVIIQQPTAILRAMDMIGAQHLTAGAYRPLKGWEKAKKYAPIAQWKDWGYFDINTGRQMKDILFDNASVLEKTKQAGMWGASMADSLAWGQLWNAVESETKAKHKGLEVGSEEFYEAVAKRFTEIVDHTQVVDGIMQRSQFMRSADGVAKMATSFMGEPTKQYNMAISALHDAKNSKGEARKKAYAKLGRSAMSLAVAGIVNACAQSIIDAMRDDDKEEKYWEKWLAAFVGNEDDKWFQKFGNLGDTFNPLTYVPYAKDILSVVQGYDVKRMDMESISKMWSATENLYKAITKTGKYTLAEASASFFAELGRLFGVPVANVKRDIKSAVMTFAIETDNYLMQYRMEKAMLDINYSYNNKNFVDILFNAYNNDSEAYELIYKDMLKSGYDADKIKSGMETRMKKAEGVKEASELKKRYMTPDTEKKYDSSLKRMQTSQTWKSASSTQRKDAEANLYSFLTSDSEDMEATRAEARALGVDETEYTLWQLAMGMANTDGKDGLSAKEKATALQHLDLDSDTEWDLYLFKVGEDKAKGARYAREQGVSADTYADFIEALYKVDKPTKSGTLGTFTQGETAEAVRSLDGLTQKEKRALYQSVNTTWKKNPF